MATFHELSDSDADGVAPEAPGHDVDCVLCSAFIVRRTGEPSQPAICPACGDKIQSGDYQLTAKG